MDKETLQQKLDFYTQQKTHLQANINAHEGAILALQDLINNYPAPQTEEVENVES